eukprot:CAMPEP_0195012072 /NCGR_PEP_ID=MMETSP0326_2-20130528/11508_1 /TAXON_ID=2866 ORGANISM="Crypthecodinium cohnii, Strain Seligo" /NCGR_SAMPLE_ID=MMETSP0326_2 /ASSEMBLY_ACC=CAM_ASM_000348 /LENGTH=53 /DNA_ID=CAMNT_0040021523 /DNA_START=481 /DNA_END=639 /DNA_ORIENTATION=+
MRKTASSWRSERISSWSRGYREPLAALDGTPASTVRKTATTCRTKRIGNPDLA